MPEPTAGTQVNKPEKAVTETAPELKKQEVDEAKVLSEISGKLNPKKKKNPEDGESNPPDNDKSDDSDGKSNESEGGGEEDPGKDEDGGEETPVVDKLLIQRAVRAGMDLADAETISSPDVLERIVDGLEGAKTQKDDSVEDDDGVLKALDLNPEEYDEGVVAFAKGVKGIFERQEKTIKELRDQVQRVNAGSEVSFVSKKVSEAKNLPPEAKTSAGRDKISRYMKLIQDDAKKNGEKITQDEIFDRSARAVFGKEMETQKGKQMAQAAKDRSGKTVMPPRDTGSGQFTGKANDDPDSAAIKMISAKLAAARGD